MGKKPPTRTNSIFAWKHDFKFIDSSANGVEFAYCKLCKVDLKISSGGKNDIQRHSETKLYKESSSAVSGIMSIANFTKKMMQYVM